MKYRYMGNTGLLVSRVCLGTMTFGVKDWGCDRKTSKELINQYLDAGGNFIDTADIYAGNASEEIIGEALKDKKRDEIVLATKCFFRTGKSPNAKGLSRKHIMEACEASLRRLQTDTIDLYYMHGADPFTPLEETMRTLNDLVRQGKVRYLGCSNIFAWQILKANGISALFNLEKLTCGQYLYNLIIREAEREVLPACKDQGMGMTCWSPLGGGILLGKYKKEEKPSPGTRLYYRTEIDGPRFWHQRGFEMVKKLDALSQKTGISKIQLALSWPLHDKRVTSVILGVKTSEQLKENLVVADWDLPDEIWEEVNHETALDLGHLTQFAGHAYRTTFGEEEV
jgi:aryl-alcohol dehydrogenase-like predicted oxidoreductase